MQIKSRCFVVLLIVVLILFTACNSGDGNKASQEPKRGASFDITGTWSSQHNDEGYELEIKIDSTDFTEGKESISGSATFSYQKLSDDWRSSQKKTVHLSDSDFHVRYELYSVNGLVYDRAIVAFSYGNAVSEMVAITFFSHDGTAYFEIPTKGNYSLIRN